MVGNKSGVNIYLAEVIDQHGQARPVRFGQKQVHEGGFAGP